MSLIAILNSARTIRYLLLISFFMFVIPCSRNARHSLIKRLLGVQRYSAKLQTLNTIYLQVTYQAGAEMALNVENELRDRAKLEGSVTRAHR